MVCRRFPAIRKRRLEGWWFLRSFLYVKIAVWSKALHPMTFDLNVSSAWEKPRQLRPPRTKDLHLFMEEARFFRSPVITRPLA
jgi:hypothetical protein